MNNTWRNERGIALVLTLLVVALLTITVVEFTYSVEVDQHMARNALSGLQASLLARSGITLGEALLLHDDDPKVDAYSEDWCPHPDSNGAACSFDAADTDLVLPDNMRLRVQIIDEGGKLNLNMTRPRDQNEWRATHATGANGAPSLAAQRVQAVQNALRQLLSGRGVDPQIADALADYWDRVFTATYGDPNAPPQQPGAAVPSPTPPNGSTDQQYLWSFPSLDDAGIIPGFTQSALRRMRPVLTALNIAGQQINVNTAPRTVLDAVIGDPGAVDDILTQRQDTPLTQVPSFPAQTQNGTPVSLRQMLGVRSFVWLIKASAIVNPNPVTGLGGISRSASMLVQRFPRAGLAQGAPAGTPRWTLTRLDWQKEAGAGLFLEKTDQEPGTDDETAPGQG